MRETTHCLGTALSPVKSLLSQVAKYDTDGAKNSGASAKATGEAISQANSGEIALRDAKRKSIEASFNSGDKVADGVAAADFTKTAESTITLQTKKSAAVLANKSASPESKVQAAQFLKTYAQPTSDGGFTPLGVAFLGEPAINELRSLYDLRTKAKELNSTGTKAYDALARGTAIAAGGALAGAVAGGKKRGVKGAVVGAVAGGLAGAYSGATRRAYSEDNNLFNYRFSPEDPNDSEGTFATVNGTRLPLGDLATVEGSNPVFPDGFKTPDGTFINNPNLVTRGVSRKPR